MPKASEKPTTNQRRPRRRRRLKRVLVAVGVVLLLVLLAPTILSFGPARSVVRSRLKEAWPGSVSVGDVSLSWFGGVRVRDVTLGDDAGTQIAALDSLRLRPRPFSLLGSHPRLGTVTASGLVAEIDPSPGGSFRRMMDVLRERRRTGGTPADFDLSAAVTLTNARITVPLPGASDGLVGEIRSATATITSLNDAIPLRVEGRAAHGDVLVQGDITLPADRSVDPNRMRGSLKAAAAPSRLADLQPLLDVLGVPLRVEGEGEVLAGLDMKEAGVEAWGQVKGATLDLHLPGAADPVRTEVTLAQASFVGPAEPVVFDCQGRAADGPFSLRGHVTLSPGGPIHLDTVKGAAKVALDVPNLKTLAPVLAAVHLPLAVTGAGRLTADISALDGVIEASGQVTGKDIVLSGGGLADRISLPEPAVAFKRLSFTRAAGRRSVGVEELAVMSRLLTAVAKGTLDLPAGGPRRLKITANASSGLPALAAALPNTLRLRQGLVVERGSVGVMANATVVGNRLDVQGAADVKDLRGAVDGRPVALDAPVRIVLDAGATAPALADLEVRLAEFRSGFATAKGKGTLNDLSFNAACDLAKLDRTLRQFADLGDVSLAGAGTATVTARRAGDGRFDLTAQAEVTDLALAGLGDAPISEPNVHLAVRGEVGTGDDGKRVAAVAVKALELRTLAVTASGSGTLRDPFDTPACEKVDLFVTADAARLPARLLSIVLPAGARVGGKIAARTTADGPFDDLRLTQQISGTGLSLSGLTVRGKPINLRCAELTLDHETHLARTDAGLRADVKRWAVRSSLLDGQGTARLAKASPIRIEEATARIDRAPLGPARLALGALLPAGLKLAGDLSGTVSAAHGRAADGPAPLTVKADLRTTGLVAEGGPLASPWSAGDVTVAINGAVRPDGKNMRLDLGGLTVRAADGRTTVTVAEKGWVRTDGSGRLSVAVRGGAADLMALMRPFVAGLPPERELRFGGDCDGVVKVTFAPGRIGVESASMTVKDFAATGTRVGSDPIRDKELRVEAVGVWDGRSGRLDLPRAAVRSALVTADLTRGGVTLSGGRVTRAEGAVRGNADLGGLSRAFGWAAGLPAEARLSGRASFDQQIETTDRVIRLKGTAPIERFAWAAGERRYAEPLIETECDVTYDTAAGSFAIRKAAVKAGSQAVAVTGSLAVVDDGFRPDLRVFVAYDAAEIAKKLDGVVPKDLRLTGKRKASFTVQGEARGRTWRQRVKGLTAAGDVGLDEVSHLGVTVHDPKLALRLAGGRLTVTQEPIRVNEGTGRLRLDVDLTADPVTVSIPEPLTVVEGVGFDHRVASAYLKFLNPALAEVGRARGRAGFRVRSMSLPIARDWKRRMMLKGDAQFKAVEMESSKLVRLVLLALKERPTGIVGDIPSFPVTVGGGRIRYGTIRVPIKDSAFELSGSAGLDETLDLVAAVPLSERMLGGDRRLKQYLTGARIRVPITGTFDDPRVDPLVVQKALDGVIRDALRKAAEIETRRLLERWLEKRRNKDD